MTRPRLIVFARYPAPGCAKTRLIPALGTHGAALLQHRMTRQTLAAAGELAHVVDVDVEVRAAGEPPGFGALYPGPWAVTPQGEGDLGERLTRAAGDAFRGGSGPVFVIGSDCPGLTAGRLAAALDELGRHDVVLGPATDGGYYLIGLRRAAPALFEDIAWGTGRVLAQTLAAAARHGLSVRRLDALPDVDRPEDLPAMPSASQPERISVTGAAGSLGARFLARMLRDCPSLHANVLVRRASDSFRGPPFRELAARYEARLTVIDVDLRSPRFSAAERRALGESDGGLWHFAADTNLAARGAAAARGVWAVNDGGTTALLEAIGSCDRPGPLFHVSTAYVCGDRGGMMLEEGAPPPPPPRGFRNEYEASKAAAEQRVRDAFARGLRGAIFRPGVIAGDGPSGRACNAVDRLADALVTAARRGEGRLVLRLPAGAAVNVVHADWVLEAMIELASRRRPEGAAYHLTARSPLCFADLADAINGDGHGECLRLDPAAEVRGLSPLSRAVDRALTPVRPYFTSSVRFDRRNVERDAPDVCGVPEFDALAVFRYRLALAQAAGGAVIGDVAPRPRTSHV